MHRKKLIVISFFLLTLINVSIFFFREKFRYRSYTTYGSLYAPCDAACENKWKQYIDDFSKEELKEAKKISDSIVLNKKGTLEKASAIGVFLYRSFHKRFGKPTADLLASSPLDQYNKLCKEDTIELWCNNLSLIFSYFCWSQGIVTRNIEIMNPGDNHVLNECYLPETNQWMAVDLTNNLLCTRSRDKILNLADLRTALRKGSGQEITAQQVAGDTIINKRVEAGSPFVQHYYLKDLTIHYYHWINYFKVYSKAHKIKEYFLPVSWYDIYREKQGNNGLFYLKLFFIFLWVVSLFVFLLSRTKFKT